MGDNLVKVKKSTQHTKSIRIRFLFIFYILLFLLLLLYIPSMFQTKILHTLHSIFHFLLMLFLYQLLVFFLYFILFYFCFNVALVSVPVLVAKYTHPFSMSIHKKMTSDQMNVTFFPFSIFLLH